MLVGWSFAQEEEPDVYYGGLGAGMALEDSEWRTKRGASAVATCAWKGLRLWSRGRPDPTDQGDEAEAESPRYDAIQGLNEPNLCLLGDAIDPEDWPPVRREDGSIDVEATAAECAAWHDEMLDNAGPDHRVWLTPFSPAPGAALGRFLAAHRKVAERCKGLLAHCYGDEPEMWTALQLVLDLARELGLPVAISECGPRNDQDYEAWGRDELPRFAERVAREAPEVVALCVFAPAWSRPDGAYTRQIRFTGTGVERWLREWEPPNPAPKPKPQEAPMPGTIVDQRGKLPVLTGGWPQLTYHPRPVGGIKRVRFHYTGGPPNQTVQAVARYQVSEEAIPQTGAGQPFPGIAYTLFVDGDGVVHLCHDLTVRVWHSSGTDAEGVKLNASAVGIVYAGRGRPNAKQVLGLAVAVDFVEQQTGRHVELGAHKDEVSTPCPPEWPTWRGEVERELADLRGGTMPEDPKVEALRNETWPLLDQLQKQLAPRWRALGWPNAAEGLDAGAETIKRLIAAGKGEH